MMLDGMGFFINLESHFQKLMIIYNEMIVTEFLAKNTKKREISNFLCFYTLYFDIFLLKFQTDRPINRRSH